MESTSSMKMIAGAFSFARRNTSRTIPTFVEARSLCTNSDPRRMNAAVV